MTILCRTLGTKRTKSLLRHTAPDRADLHDHRYDFDYEDEDDEESGDIGIENKYYNAKQMKGDNPEEAVDEFLGIPALEQDKSEWFVFDIPDHRRVASADSTSQGIQRVEAGYQIRVQIRAIQRCEYFLC